MGCFDKKQNNTFKFRSFAEQLADISVDVSRQVALCRSATPSVSPLSDDVTSDTFFYAALVKWSELNFTLHYTEFVSELGPGVQSFTQLLLKKDHVVQVLVKHLYVPDTMALQPLLELLTALARDLSVDFYPIFTEQVAALMYKHLLRATVPEKLGWIFSCLAYLYKLLWRPLVANMSATIDMYADMVSGRKLSEHMARFVAESFAFVCRKSKDKLALFTLVYDRLADNEKLYPVIGRLIFECIRGVRGRLHVDTSCVLASQMELVSRRPLAVTQCVSQALLAAAGHVTERQHAEPLWPPLWTAVLSSQLGSEAFSSVCSLLGQLISYRSGSLTPASSPAALTTNCRQLLLTAAKTAEAGDSARAAVDAALSVIADTVVNEKTTLSAANICTLHDTVLNANITCQSVISYTIRLLDHPLFDSRLLPPLLLYIHKLVPCGGSSQTASELDDGSDSRSHTEEGSDSLSQTEYESGGGGDIAEMVTDLLSRIILHKRPLLLCSDQKCWSEQQQQQCESYYPLDFSFAIHTRQSRRNSSNTKQNSAVNNSSSGNSTWLWQYINNGLLRASHTDAITCRTAQLALLAGHVLPTTAVSQQLQQTGEGEKEGSVGEIVSQLWHKCYDCLADRVTDDIAAAASYSESDILCRVAASLSYHHHQDDEQHNDTMYNQLLLLTESLLRLRSDAASSYQHLPRWQLLLKLLVKPASRGKLQLLRCLDQLTEAAAQTAGKLADVGEELMRIVFNLLSHNLASPHYKIRMLTLNIMLSCCKLTGTSSSNQPADDADSGLLTVLQLCVSAERQPLTLASYRERQRFLGMLESDRVQSILPEPYKLLPVLYLLGSLHLPFSLLWPVCSQLLIGHCRQMTSARLTPLWSIVLRSAANAAQSSSADVSSRATSRSGTSVTLCPAERFLCEQLLPLDDRVDVCNYRLLLWKLTGQMADALEPDGVDMLASLFVDFIRDELCAGDLSVAQWQDLTASNSPSSTTTSTTTPSAGEDSLISADEDSDSEGEDSRGMERNTSRRVRNSAIVRKKGIIEVLCAHLTTIAHLTQMRRSAAYSAQLCELFERFLAHKRTDVQRAALQCLMAYRVKSLHIYSDLLLSLLDDTNFKSRLTGLNLSDSESADIQPAHRKDVLPLLNRILYGRMRGSTGAGASSRDNAANRRRLVAGVLASYSPQEIGLFLDLTLDLFQHLPFNICDFTDASPGETEGALLELARAVTSHTCVRRSIPLSRLQSGIVLLSALVARLGRLMAPCLSTSLLPRLVAAAAHVKCLLNIAAGNVVTAGDSDTTRTLAGTHVRVLKKIRSQLLRCVRDLFDRLDDYEWSVDQLSALFHTCIQPSLRSLLLNTACSSASRTATTTTSGGGAGGGGITPVLRLLLTWANHERYMPLLLWRVESSGASQFDDSSLTDQSNCDDSPVVTKSPTTEKSSITLIALLVGVLASRQDGSSGASAAIMRAFETMLTHQRHSSARQHQHQAADESAEAELPPLLPPGCQPLVNTDTVGVGSAVILTILPSLLDYLQSRVQQLSSSTSSITTTRGANKPQQQRQLSNSELHVLSAVCSLCYNYTAVSPSIGNLYTRVSTGARQMALVLIGVLSSDKQIQTAEQQQLQLLNVLKQLISVAEGSHELVRPITPLFSYLPSSDSHHIIVQCCQSILTTLSSAASTTSTIDSERELADVAEVCRLVGDLNAVDGGRLQEPDYDRRLACFTRVNARLATLESQVPDTYLRVLVHNCIWLLEHEDDMALRDNAVNTLEQLLMTIGRHVSATPGFSCSTTPSSCRQPLLQLLNTCILPLLRVRLRAINDQLRHNCVRLLRAAVLHCSGHVVSTAATERNQQNQSKISQLAPLCCVQDDEQDFFVNISHLQVSRRGRALKRLLTGMESGQFKISAEVFTNYILPLANVYLFNDKYRKHTGLVDNAIKLVGVASALMTWHQYQLLLRHYLRILPTCAIPRHAIRLIIAVLDKFPFRLSEVNDPDIEPPTLTETSDMDQSTPGCDVTESTETIPDNDNDAIASDRDDNDDDEDSSIAVAMETTTAKSAADTVGARQKRQSVLILRQLSATIVPSLLRVLRTVTAVSKVEPSESRQSVEEERVVRVPLAVAVMKLILHLPETMQQQYVPNVIGSVCELMLSRVATCRSAALDTLGSCLQLLTTHTATPASQTTTTTSAEVGGWLGVFIEQLRANLARGYQLHVLLFAVAELLAVGDRQLVGRSASVSGVGQIKVKADGVGQVKADGVGQVKADGVGQIQVKADGFLAWRQQLADCAHTLLQLCHMELFNLRSDSATIGSESSRDKFDRVPEAKGVKVYRIVLTLSRHATEQSLYLIIQHLTQWTSMCRSEKACLRLRECYRQCQIGLTENTELPIASLLVLCHGLIARKITTSSTLDDEADSGKSAETKPVLTRVDSRLLPEAPTNAGKLETSVNEYILVEFGLSLLSAILRKQRAEFVSTNLAKMISPLMSHLTQYLQHSDVRVISECLQCWLAVIKLRVIDILSEHVCALRDSVFVTLHSYSSASADLLHADNHQLLTSVFKVITGLVRDISSLRLTDEQLRILLLHIENSLRAVTNPARRGSSGPRVSDSSARYRRVLLRHLLALLAAILSRRFHSDELPALMQLVVRTCIQSADGSSIAVVQLNNNINNTAAADGAVNNNNNNNDGGGGGDVSGQTRALYIRYLLDYPLTPAQLDKHVTFVLQQLSYSGVYGRRAALHVCASICRQFPQQCLDSLCPLLFIYMASRLVCDSDSMCRRMLSRTVHSLLQKVSVNTVHHMVDMCHKWLQQVDSQKSDQVTMAALLLSSVFFTTEISARMTSLQHVQLFSTLCRCITASSLITPSPHDHTNTLNTSDMQLFQLVTAVRKLVSVKTHLLTKPLPDQPNTTFADQLWDVVGQILLHQHVWVRVASGELLGQLMSSLDSQYIAQSLRACGAANDDSASLPSPMRHNLVQFLRSLALDLCQQLFGNPLPEQLANQCTKNLVWLARILVDANLITAPATTRAVRVRPPLAPPPEDDDDEEEEAECTASRLSLNWVVRRLRRCVNAEVRAVSIGSHSDSLSATPNAGSLCRVAMFRWTAAVFAHATEGAAAGGGSCHVLEPLLVQMVTPLVRELNDSAGDGQLHQLANEVADLIKSSVGVELYTASFVEAQRRIADKKNQRKIKRTTEAVTNPAKTARLKIKKNLKKNESRKRKLAQIRSVGFKRRKAS